MANKTQRTRIIWTIQEYVSIFKKMKEYVKVNSTLPKQTEFSQFIKHLPASRQRIVYYQMSNAMRSAYVEWHKGSDISIWYPLTGRANQVKVSKSASDAVPKSKQQLVVEVEDIVIPPNGPHVTINAISNLFDAKFSPILEILNQFKPTPPEIKVPEVKVPEVVKQEPVIVKPVTEVNVTGPNIARMFTETEIRSIIRQEIESIFGSLTKPVEIKTTAVVTAKKTNSPVTFTPPVAEQLVVKSEKQYSIYIYGLDSVQMTNIRKQLPPRITIDGATTFSHSIKDKAKNCSLVLVSKFTNHATEKSLISACGKEKVEFISGGMSMIMRRINDFVITNDKAKF